MADPTTPTPPATPAAQNTPASPLAPPATATPAAPSEIDTLKQQLAAAQKLIDDRKAADAAAAQQKLVADGKLTEALAAKDAELAALKPLADSWKAYEMAEAARISAAMASLPADKQALINAQPNVTLKAQLLAAFSGTPASTSTPPPAAPPPGGGPPPAGTNVDDLAAAQKALSEGMSADAIRQKFPQGFAALSATFLPPPRLTSFAQQQVAAAAANGKKG